MQSSQAVGFVSRLAAIGALVFAALSLADGAAKPPAATPLKPPFEITEDRPGTMAAFWFLQRAVSLM